MVLAEFISEEWDNLAMGVGYVTLIYLAFKLFQFSDTYKEAEKGNYRPILQIVAIAAGTVLFIYLLTFVM